jgi:NADPH-dependent glutamate synthase beta subunit-like oxidoreductase
LSCAGELAKDGFQVTVFEEHAEPGGVIRYGVPAYRFDRKFLKNELQDLKDLGVAFKCRAKVEGPQGAEKLLKSGYQAVFVAPGLWGAQRLKPGKKTPKGVYTSVEFLQLLREQQLEELARQLKGKTVAVIGGGSVAMDCVESALKLGARDAYLVYRRSFAQMPAEEDERLAALRLGVHFLVLNQPTDYLASDGKLKGLKLVRTRLGQPDESGRRRPEEIKGSAWTLECAVAVEAIGNLKDEAVDWSSMLKTGQGGLILADRKSGKTSAKRIYAGGDIARGPALVVEAVQDGKLAARAIQKALGKE